MPSAKDTAPSRRSGGQGSPVRLQTPHIGRTLTALADAERQRVSLPMLGVPMKNPRLRTPDSYYPHLDLRFPKVATTPLRSSQSLSSLSCLANARQARLQVLGEATNVDFHPAGPLLA